MKRSKIYYSNVVYIPVGRVLSDRIYVPGGYYRKYPREYPGVRSWIVIRVPTRYILDWGLEDMKITRIYQVKIVRVVENNGCRFYIGRPIIGATKAPYES